MKIGINGRFLVAKQTGVQRAAYNLVKALFEIDRKNTYFLFTGRSQLDNPNWKLPNVKVIASPIQEGESFRNHLWEQITLPRLARKYGVDILHSPANMAPLMYSGKSVVHIHDLCFVVNPQWYSFLFHRVYNFVVPRLAKKSTIVVTNSNNSRNDLFQFCDVDSEKVRLIYWAVDETFHNPPEDDVLDKVEEDNYILYVGSLEPRKNISTLIRAYEKLRESNPDINSKLILIGGESPLFADAQLQIRKYKQDIVFKGFVTDELLKAYYRKAAVVAYPSLYEGFGLPPLEAMACSAPVVTSNTSSIPEVVGDAALLVSPYDVGQVASALALVIQSPELRKKMSQLGAQQIKKFNWYRVARNILGVYYEVSSSTNSSAIKSCLPFAVWQNLAQKEQKFLEANR
ncbi:MAG: glycosyltransferase family 4 protein [Pseudobacteriovorax sp.]|nr:glycosyltransferase family 4 protein [Pseudobacteriovorax sp.]